MTAPVCKMLVRNLLKSSRLQVSSLQHCRTIWNSNKSIDFDTLVKVQKDYDLSAKGLVNWWEKKRWRIIKEDHSYNIENHEALGSDLYAAHFIVARGGMVKAVGSDIWVKREDGKKKWNLPYHYDPSWQLEAFEKSDMIFLYTSFSNLVNLEHLKYMGLRGGRYIDDWCLDAMLPFGDTLAVLDISGCKNVTERGLPTLRRLKKLKRLRMYDMEGLKNPGLALLLLEDMLPNVVIETDIKYSDNKEDLVSKSEEMEKFYEDNGQSLPGKIKDLELDMRTHKLKSGDIN